MKYQALKYLRNRLIIFTMMSIQTKYESLSPEAQKQIEDFLDFLLSKEEENDRTSIEQYNKELNEANERIDSGIFTSHESVKEQSKKWF